MFKDKLIDILKDKTNIESDREKKMTNAIFKIEKQKRLSSQEFLSVYDSFWKEGPSVQFQNPSDRLRYPQSINDSQNP